MLISNLFDYFDRFDEDIAFGLAVGLAFGLAVGLAFGLAVGLAFGLVFGLVFGLAFGLAVGLVFGLAFGLAVGLGAGITNFPELGIPLWVFALTTFLLIEIFFWLDKKKPGKKENKLWFTTKRKAEALLESLIIVVNILNLNWIIRNVDWQKHLPSIIKWIGYVGIGIISVAGIIGLGYAYIWLNSQKYKK